MVSVVSTLQDPPSKNPRVGHPPCLFNFVSTLLSVRSECSRKISLREQARYSQVDSKEPGWMMVASRSGPVEIMPISTWRKSEMNFR